MADEEVKEKRRPGNPNFYKGMPKAGPGRAKGTTNKTSMLLRSALTNAAIAHGYDGTGLDGLQGFCKFMLETHLEHFWAALVKTMPQATGEPTEENVAVLEYRTIMEMRQAVMERGLPMRTILELVDPTMKTITQSKGNGHGNGEATNET